MCRSVGDVSITFAETSRPCRARSIAACDHNSSQDSHPTTVEMKRTLLFDIESDSERVEGLRIR
jgi:hypothetical protein